jgi:AcrR family transcriptional regulator
LPRDTFFNLEEEKQERIIDVAISEFEIKTYQNVSVNTIVRKAHISKGSFYQYFEDKKDLYQFLIDKMVQEKLKYITEAMSNPLNHGFFELMRDTYRSGLEFAKDNPRYLNIGNMLFADNTSPLYQEIVKNNVHRSRQIYEKLMMIGIERGEVKSDIDIPMMAHIISDMHISIIEYYQKNISTDFDEKMLVVLDGLIKFLKEGIGVPETN